MTERTKFNYSLNFSFGSILLMLILMTLLLVSTINAGNMMSWAIYALCTMLFLFLLTSIILKRLIPALHNDVALELDDDGLSDYIRDISINWADIEDITLTRGRSAASIFIKLKWESYYGRTLSVPLRWVKGNDADIFESVLFYFEQNKEQNIGE